MNPRNLLDELKHRPLLCDGAMGTQLMARGLAPGACGELWNANCPLDVESIHRSYRDAGCELITTNTFGGSSAALARHGLGERSAELNRAGAEVARLAAGSHAWVLGDVGPFGGFLEPMGEMTADQLLSIFREQATALYEGGADAVIVETMSDATEAVVAIRAAKDAGNRPVIATYAFGKAEGGTFRTMMGTTVADALHQAIDAGADVIGANCGTSLNLQEYVALAKDLMAVAAGTPVILQPNAGSPRTVDGRLVYPATPVDMADMIEPLLKMGVRIIGGCCGTSPKHLQAMAAAIQAAAH